jgi:cytochrome c oxidase assembly protein subunit 11
VVRIEFDTNLHDMPWKFRALQTTADIHPGAVTQVVFEVVNTSREPVTGQAIPSYGPRNAAQYFRKLDCFCFTRQTLAPGETRRMPVVFVVDPSMPKDLSTITLSYTFFKVEGNARS